MLTLAQPDLRRPLPPQRSAPAALKCGWERPSEIAREITVLANRFTSELGQPPYEPDWARIFALERAQSAIIWSGRTARGTLVAYLGVTFNRGLFTGLPYSRIEAGYLLPEWREGSFGVRFIKGGIDAIERINGNPIEWETNDAFAPDANGRSRLATLLKRLGFEQVGTCMRLK